jgi:hypothetical protein
LPLGYRAKIIWETAIAACGLYVLLAIASFCLESWPPAKSGFDPLPSADGVIDVRILDSGLWGFKSYHYQIDLNEGRVLELENKSLSSEEFANPPGRPHTGAHIDTGSSHNFAGIASPDGEYVAASSGDGAIQSNGAGQVPIFVERVSDHTEVFRASIPPRYYVRGATWSPDSKAVALLLSSERIGFGPLDILSAFAGHPIQYKSFGFLILSIVERRSVGVMRFAGGFAGGGLKSSGNRSKNSPMLVPSLDGALQPFLMTGNGDEMWGAARRAETQQKALNMERSPATERR